MVFGFGKKKQEEMKEIREAITPTNNVIPRPLGMPELDRIDIPSVSEPKQFAPLFIKVERYKDVLQKVQKLKSIANNINSLLVTQEEIDRVRTDSIISLRKSIAEFADVTSQLDQELVRPQHFEPFIKESSPSIEGYNRNLKGEVERLKQRMETL